jgi:hypothetical protein
MSLRKPFRARPVRPGSHHRLERRRAYFSFAAKAVVAGAAGGLFFGALSVPTVRQQLTAASVTFGVARARTPQAGDYWPGCDARAAGTAPIYAGEPGYRSGMDGDGDGIACEPYRGR